MSLKRLKTTGLPGDWHGRSTATCDWQPIASQL